MRLSSIGRAVPSPIRHHLGVIDKSGEWWIGTEASDIDEYLRTYTEDGYPASLFAQAVCICGLAVFRLRIDNVEGCAHRTCTACGREHLICDSDEFVGDATLTPVTCPSGGDEFEIAVGFSHSDATTVRWITVGVRCVQCGLLGSPVDWKIDYTPTAHLYDRV